jgi:hypothetical protein
MTNDDFIPNQWYPILDSLQLKTRKPVFILMNEDLPATIAWFRTPARVLDWTSPRDLILRGDFPKVRNLVSEVHSGLSL